MASCPANHPHSAILLHRVRGYVLTLRGSVSSDGRSATHSWKERNGSPGVGPASLDYCTALPRGAINSRKSPTCRLRKSTSAGIAPPADA